MENNLKVEKLILGPLLTNCYLVFSEGEALIIDPGAEEEEILERIMQETTKLKYIINTHSHPDHTLGDIFIKKKIGGKILIHEAEKNFINFKPDRFLKNGDEIDFGNVTFKVLHTPGHTKGSICLLSEKLFFSGDTLFKDGIGRTDLIGGSKKEMEGSLKKLRGILKPGMLIFPGHGDDFKIGKLGLNLKNFKKFFK